MSDGGAAANGKTGRRALQLAHAFAPGPVDRAAILRRRSHSLCTEPEERPNGPSWFRGLVPWNELQVPVIRVEELCGLEPVSPGGRTRLAIFNCVSDALPAGFFGVLTEGFPQLVRVNRDVMELHDEHAWPDDGPIICQIRMINEYPLIPDLERIEILIQDCLADAA